MKENTPVLYASVELGEAVTAYSHSKSTDVPKHIQEYADYVRETEAQSNMMISTSQSQLSLMLAKITGAKRILEVGVYVGLSGLVWSHAVGPTGKVTGLEFDPGFAKKAEAAFAKYGVKNVEVLVGDAAETLPTLTPDEPYDLVFIDANKPGYLKYLEIIMAASQPGSPKRLLKENGLIMADNVLWTGFVADNSVEVNPWRKEKFSRPDHHDGADVHALRAFNDAVSASDRLENFLLPMFDGLNLIRLVN